MSGYTRVPGSDPDSCSTLQYRPQNMTTDIRACISMCASINNKNPRGPVSNYISAMTAVLNDNLKNEAVLAQLMKELNALITLLNSPDYMKLTDIDLPDEINNIQLNKTSRIKIEYDIIETQPNEHACITSACNDIDNDDKKTYCKDFNSSQPCYERVCCWCCL